MAIEQVHGAKQPRVRSPLLKAVKAVAFTATTAATVVVVSRLLPLALVPQPAAALAAGAVAGYLSADLLSGTVHWFCDTFFDEDTPIIGRTVIWPFRDHHRHPQAITEYGLLEQDSTNYLLLVAPLAFALRAGAPVPSAMLAVGAQGALCGFAFGAIGTNLFHKWAHMAEPPRLAAWLQRRGLILSPEAHQVHHRSYTGGYCVTSGWLNPLFDRIDFFGGVERLVRLVAGPRRAE